MLVVFPLYSEEHCRQQKSLSILADEKTFFHSFCDSLCLSAFFYQIKPLPNKALRLKRCIMRSHKLMTEQYQNSSNLDALIQLHSGFSTNKYDWSLWVFDRFHLPTSSRILELGCGTGKLWRENLNRIPTSLSITLSEFQMCMFLKRGKI